MTQEEKQLLLVDLCARLPYGTEISLTDGTSGMITSISIVPHGTFVTVYFNRDNVEDVSLEDIKPYLRPMSSMTEEEKKEFDKLIGGENTNWKLFVENRIAHCKSFYSVFCYFSTMGKIIDFFNSHHLDYHGLIPMGLALEAKEGMYKIG